MADGFVTISGTATDDDRVYIYYRPDAPASTTGGWIYLGYTQTEAGAGSGGNTNPYDDSSPTFRLTTSLPAGTYAVSDFSYFSTAAGGGTVPFLGVLNGADTYDLLWIGSQSIGTLDSTVSVNPAGYFTLAAPATVYGGFYTTTIGTAGGRVAYTTLGANTVDHALSWHLAAG